MPKITAKDIIRLLRRRHDLDLFIGELCNGHSFAKDAGRLDAWAIRRSYATPMSWGYEVKVSRTDFLNDDKWQKYLPCCRQFYFVCPHGLIDKDEVPKGVGLIYVTKTGSRLLRKKKAVSRDVELPQDFLFSILFNRCIVTETSRWRHEEGREERVERFKRIAEDTGRIDEIVKAETMRRIHDAERTARDAKERADCLEEVDAYLTELGIDRRTEYTVGHLEARFEERDLRWKIERLASELKTARKDLLGLIGKGDGE